MVIVPVYLSICIFNANVHLCIYMHIYDLCVHVYTHTYKTHKLKLVNKWLLRSVKNYEICKYFSSWHIRMSLRLSLCSLKKPKTYSPMQPVDRWLSECPLYEFL